MGCRLEETQRVHLAAAPLWSTFRMHPAPPAPRAGLSPTSPGRLVAGWVLVAAVLYVVACYAPIFGAEGETFALSDDGFDSTVVFLLPAVLGALGAIVGLVGRPIGSIIGAGVVGGGAGYAITLLTFTWYLISGDSNDELSFFQLEYEWGYFVLIAATAVALFALVAGLAASRDAVRGAAPQPVFATLAGLAFVGVPLSLLLPENGVSVWDFPDNAVKASVIAWAVLAPLVGFAAAMGRTRGGVALALGVAIGHFGVVVALARSDWEFDDGSTSLVMREPIFVGSVVAAVVLCVLALVLAPGVLSPTAQAMAEHAPTPAGIAAPPPVVDLTTTEVTGRWDEDPFGRHQLRWFDGHRWTERVMNNLVETQDQPGWSDQGGPSLPT